MIILLNPVEFFKTHLNYSRANTEILTIWFTDKDNTIEARFQHFNITFKTIITASMAKELLIGYNIKTDYELKEVNDEIAFELLKSVKLDKSIAVQVLGFEV